MKSEINNIRWLGFEGILITGKPAIYINPYKLAFPDVGDLILFTDNKPEHCSPDDVKWLRKGSTIIIGPVECAKRFQGDVRAIKAGDSISTKGVTIQAVQAIGSHNKEIESSEGIGLIISFPSGLSVYHTGDTILMQEMHPGMADVLLIPINFSSIDGIVEASKIVNQIKPKVTIPINWDEKKDSMDMINQFKKLCQSDVKVLKPKP